MTGRSKAPDGRGRAALGVRAHSGWAAYVVLGGRIDAPDILKRGRMELCDASIKGSKQPFHEAEPLPFDEGSRFIARCSKATAALADKVLVQIQSEVSPLAACCVLTASGRALPELRAILASHALIHAAEGEFYRDAVVEACARSKIPTERMRERDIDAAADRLPGNMAARRQRLDAFGKQVGTPWRQDEKLAALAAWLALASKASRKSPGSP
jgi:hypothetical protein